MSFRTSSGKSGRAFECVRRSLLQADELPFSNVLTAERLAEVFESDGVDFANADDDPDVVYTPAVTFWAFLSQMLFTGEQRSCTAAVARVAAVEALQGRVVSDTNSGAYCRARSRIPEAVPQRLALEMVSGFAMGQYSGKETGETALFRQLFELLQAGDVVVADRYDSGWFMIALMAELGVDVVTRLHQHRKADFRQGRRWGADDHLVEWPKPQRPESPCANGASAPSRSSWSRRSAMTRKPRVKTWPTCTVNAGTRNSTCEASSPRCPWMCSVRARRPDTLAGTETLTPPIELLRRAAILDQHLVR
jgi:hypothetical protein